MTDELRALVERDMETLKKMHFLFEGQKWAYAELGFVESLLLALHAGYREPMAQALELLKEIEWNGHGMRKCPSCFGWEPKGNGETEAHHNKGCRLVALRSALATPPMRDPGNEETTDARNARVLREARR